MKKLIGTLILAGSSLFAGPRIAIVVGIGVPVAPAPVIAVPPCPGPGYTWVAGYTYGGVWHAGYWARPVAPVVVAPHYRGRFVVRGRRW